MARGPKRNIAKELDSNSNKVAGKVPRKKREKKIGQSTNFVIDKDCGKEDSSACFGTITTAKKTGKSGEVGKLTDNY